MLAQGRIRAFPAVLRAGDMDLVDSDAFLPHPGQGLFQGPAQFMQMIHGELAALHGERQVKDFAAGLGFFSLVVFPQHVQSSGMLARSASRSNHQSS